MMAAKHIKFSRTVSDVPAVLKLAQVLDGIHPFHAEPGLLGDGRNIFTAAKQRRGRRGRGVIVEQSQ